MKRCPRCATDYFDEMLEFCLEDGAKLSTVSQTSDGAPTVTRPNKPNPFTEKTFSLPFTAAAGIEVKSPNELPPTVQNNFGVENKPAAGTKVLEILPVIFALLHNWWQWLYAANQTYPSIPGFLLSVNFLIWLLLLAAGAVISFLAFKRTQNKGYAMVSMVILSINLILFLVPKR